MSTHTPGPWRYEIDQDEDLRAYAYVRSDESKIVAQVFSPDGGFFVRQANGRLMAASPQLLNACEAMLRACGGSENWNGETHEALKLIEAAILKARGA